MTAPANVAGQFGDTTYTKIFVGGLAWETQRDTMRKYFEQFGEILEAVVISDKNTGRSKGYGFVTFCEPEAAMRACIDPTPVIDGRRANCNLASLGLQRSRPTTPLHGGGGGGGGGSGSRNMRSMKAFQGGGGGMGTAFRSPAAAATFPHYAIQQGSMPYNLYGYSPYSSDQYSTYPTNYYNFYGGAAAPYPLYGGATTGYYPYFQLGQGAAATTTAAAASFGQGYGMQYPQIFQYSAANSTAGLTDFQTQLYGGPMSLAPSSATQAGMTMALTAPSLPSPAAHHYRLIPDHFAATTAPEQPLA